MEFLPEEIETQNKACEEIKNRKDELIKKFIASCYTISFALYSAGALSR